MGKEKDLHTISTQVPGAEHEHYQGLAQTQGVSLATFARDTLRKLYPLVEQAAPPSAMIPRPITPVESAAPVTRSVRDEVDAILGDVPNVAGLSDDLSALEDKLYGVMTPPTASAPTPTNTPSVGVAPRVGLPMAPMGEEQHPCQNLDRNPPRRLSRADCQGSCRVQHGRPCHWPAQTAKECMSFRGMRRGPGIVL